MTIPDRSASAVHAALVVLFALGLMGAIEVLGRSARRPTSTTPPPRPGDFAARWAEPASVTTIGSRAFVTRPARSPDVFPCSECHEEGQDELTPRALTLAHAEVRVAHGANAGWCFDCHDPARRDELRLAGGARVPLDDATTLCAQCHGRERTEWETGVHGRRTGRWDGARTELLCVQCHDAHAPRFVAPAALPPPMRPGE
jgi:hypothetical protein